MSTEITAATANAILAEADAALRAIAAKHGLILERGRGSFNPGDKVGCKISFRQAMPTATSPLKSWQDYGPKVDIASSKINADGTRTDLGKTTIDNPFYVADQVKPTPELIAQLRAGAPFGPEHRWTNEWFAQYRNAGLPLEALGRTIPYMGKMFRIAGYTKNSKKGNIILEIRGKYMTVGISEVRRILGA